MGLFFNNQKEECFVNCNASPLPSPLCGEGGLEDKVLDYTFFFDIS
jgi:hypothetical protein